MHVIPIFGGWRQENLKMEVILGYRARHHGLHDTLSQNKILLTAEETVRKLRKLWLPFIQCNVRYSPRTIFISLETVDRDSSSFTSTMLLDTQQTSKTSLVKKEA